MNSTELQELKYQWKNVVGWFDLVKEMEDGTRAIEWVNIGVTPEQYQQWKKANANEHGARLYPDKVKLLIDHGITPIPASLRVTRAECEALKLPYSGETLCYMFCQSHIALDEIDAILKKRDLEAQWKGMSFDLYCEIEFPWGTIQPLHWFNEGFTPDEAWQWWNINAPYPKPVKALKEAGFTLEQLTKLWRQDDERSIACAFCLEFITLEQVRELVD